jgi:hypothetical protein
LGGFDDPLDCVDPSVVGDAVVAAGRVGCIPFPPSFWQCGSTVEVDLVAVRSVWYVMGIGVEECDYGWYNILVVDT